MMRQAGARLALVLATVSSGVAGAQAPARWCDTLPRAVNRTLESVASPDPWFDVRRVEPGVFAIGEPRQWQEAIAWLIVGSSRALLLDTGIGVRPIRPVVERLTSLPVTVVNTHSHFDHVGGNWEFADVLGMATDFTRRAANGVPHDALASEVAAGSFCDGPPAGLDTAAFRGRPWRITGHIADGTAIDLGGRTLTVMAAPGHTPDAIALLDREAGLLWTGDSFYAGPIFLMAPETDLLAYERTVARFAALAPSLRRVLPAHNGAVADPAVLTRLLLALQAIRAGTVTPSISGKGRRRYAFDGFDILVSERALAAWQHLR